MVALKSMKPTAAERKASEGDGMPGNDSRPEGVPVRLEHDRQYWRETAFMEEKRAKAAENRLAERDASASRWVRLGCVLTLLLPLTAHAADAPPTPPQQVVSATIPPPVEPPLQPVTLSPDDYRQLINSRINELIRQDPVAQMLIAHQNDAQAKAKPGG